MQSGVKVSGTCRSGYRSSVKTQTAFHLRLIRYRIPWPGDFFSKILRMINGEFGMDSARWRNFPTAWPFAWIPQILIISSTRPTSTSLLRSEEEIESAISHCLWRISQMSICL
jgi:hypothetical protein